MVFVEESARDRKISFGFSGTVRASSQCSLAVEHPLSKREVVGSNPAIGFFVAFHRCVNVVSDSVLVLRHVTMHF